jgi:hypothetical protein
MRIAWIALALMVAGGAWADSNPPSPTPAEARQPPQQQPESKKTDAGNPGEPGSQQSPPIVVTASPSIYLESPHHEGETDKKSAGFWEILGVVFSGLVAIVGFLQWLTYQKQTKLLSSAQRAYVYLREIHHEYVPSADGVPREVRFSPLFVNSGTTPTKRSICHTSAEVSENSLPDDFQFADKGQEESPRKYDQLFLGPKAERRGPFVEVHVVDLDPNKKRRIFIWGWIDYDDILHGTPRHRTEFGFEIIAKPNPAKGPDAFSVEYRQLDRFNGADDECHHQPRPYKEMPL